MIFNAARIDANGRIRSGYGINLDTDDCTIKVIDVSDDGYLLDVTLQRHRGHDVGVYPKLKVWVETLPLGVK